MVLDEEAKATQEIAKVAGKITGAARETGGFIARYIGDSLEQGIGIFEDKLKHMRWERQVRLMQRADEFLRERFGRADQTGSNENSHSAFTGGFFRRR
jgi:hypothetical protein